MTSTITLKEKATNGVTVAAYARQEKDSLNIDYAVTVFDGAFERVTAKAARTTWKKRFNEMTAQYLRG